MGVGAAGLYMYDVVVKSSRSLSHLLMSSCISMCLTVRLLWPPYGIGQAIIFSNRSHNRLNVCTHDTAGCQSGCQTGLTTG